MKKRVWLFVFVALLVLGLPGLLGILAERQVRAQLAEVELYEDLVAIDIARYERGWFASEVVYELGLAPSYAEQLQATIGAATSDGGPERAKLVDELSQELSSRIELVSRVRHGPVGILDGLFLGLFRAITTAGDTNPAIAEFVQSSGMPHLFEARTTTGFFGSTDVLFTVPPIAASGANIGEPDAIGAIRFSGLNIKGEVQVGARAAQVAGGFESLEIDGEEAELSLTGVQLSADSRAISEHLWAGPVALTADEFVVRAKGDEPSLSARALVMQLQVAENSGGETMDMNLHYAAQRLQLAGSLLEDAQMDIQLKSLSIAAMESYYSWSQSLAIVDDAALAQIQSEVQDLAYQFAQQAPTLALAPVQFSLNGEPFAGTLSVHLDSAALPNADSFDLTDIAMWSQAASAEGSVTLSKAMAESLVMSSVRAQMQAAFAEDPDVDADQLEEMARMQAPMMLVGLVQQGLIREADKQYSADLIYRGGELTVNGQPMPLGALLQ